LHCHADNIGDNAGCDVVAPVGSGPAPVIPLVGLVDRQNRSADVLRVQVYASDARPGRGENDSYIVGFNTRSHRIEIVDLENNHVPAIAFAFVELTAGGCASPHRGDHLENLVSNRKERVFETEHPDVGVSVAQLYAEFFDDAGLYRRQIGSYQSHLPKSQSHIRVLWVKLHDNY
jgi:hypothetical protein